MPNPNPNQASTMQSFPSPYICRPISSSSSTSQISGGGGGVPSERESGDDSDLEAAVKIVAKNKKTYDTWSQAKQKLLVSLWVEHFERLESNESRKAWQDIADTLNNKLGCNKTKEKCKLKIKYLTDRYKDAKQWNKRQTGGHTRKTLFYEEIDSVLGCPEIVTLKYVEQAGAGTRKKATSDEGEAKETTDDEEPGAQKSRYERKKSRSRKRQREIEKDEEEQSAFKEIVANMKEQREDMKTLMTTFTDMQKEQSTTMNNFLTAMTQFFQKE